MSIRIKFIVILVTNSMEHHHLSIKRKNKYKKEKVQEKRDESTYLKIL